MTDLATAIHAFLGLPGLRGFWPLNSFDESGNAYDLSGHAQTLTRNNTPTYGINQLGAGYAEFDSGDYFERADATHYDILGTEAYVGSGKKGLTVGGWFYFPVFTGVHQGINKSDFINNCAYELTNVSSGSAVWRFGVSGDGTNGARKFATMTGTLPVGQWHFLVGRFTPSTEVAVFTNKTKAVNTTSIPAAIFNSSRGLRIDENNAARAAMCFLSAEVISDALLDDLYDASLPLFDTGPDVSETITLTEAVSRNLVSLVKPAQTVTLTEAQTVRMATAQVSQNQAVTLTEGQTVRVGTAVVSQNETITLTEAQSVSVSTVQVSQNQAITLTEGQSVIVSTASISQNETVTLTEAQSVILAGLVSQAETITLSEAGTTVLLVSLASASETVTLTEGVTVTLAAFTINAAETVTVSELTLISAGGSTDVLISVSETVTLTEAAGAAPFEILTIVVYDTLALAETVSAPLFSIADTLGLTDSIIGTTITDTLTLTDLVTIGNVTMVVEDILTFTEVLELDGPTVPPPAIPATGGLDTDTIVLRLIYGNDRRNPIRTLDLAQTAPGAIRLMAGGFAPGAGERTQLWSGESIRFDGQDLLAESRKNSQLSITYTLKTGSAGSGVGSQAALSYFQRKVSRFFNEAKQHQILGQTHTVWLEYRWSDGLNDLATPTFGQLSGYYEVFSATAPKWPDSLHNDFEDLSQGLIAGVVMEITGSPAPLGLKQRAGEAGGDVTLHEKGVKIDSGSFSRLHWAGYTDSGLTGQFHITGWMTLTTTWGSGNKDVFDYYVSASNRIRIIYDATNTRWTITKIVGGVTFTTNSSTDAVANGDDVHLQLVQNATTLYLYVNGILAASVAATATMTDGGTIALGCPATGTLDGVDVILDGWRIMPAAVTSTQALALYEAELPIKQDGGQVGPPPYWWTKDGDSTVDNCDDATRDNWGIIGGVGGDLEAETEIRLELSIDYGSRIYYLGIRSQGDAFDPSTYIFVEAGSNTISADLTASAGSFSKSTNTTMNFYSLTAPLADPSIVLGQYRMLARLNMPTTPVISLTPKLDYAGNGVGLLSGKTISYTGAADWRLVDLGDLFIKSDSRVLLDDNLIWQPLLTASAGSSFTGQCDFIHLLPYPYARIEAAAAIPAGATSQLIIENERAFVINDLPTYNTQEMNLEYRGAALTVAPQRYNYLFILQAFTTGALTITQTLPVTVYVTPRYLLPGGMVA